MALNSEQQQFETAGVEGVNNLTKNVWTIWPELNIHYVLK